MTQQVWRKKKEPLTAKTHPLSPRILTASANLYTSRSRFLPLAERNAHRGVLLRQAMKIE